MFLRTWRLITLVLAALTMGMAFCHTLELPAKMGYDATLYTRLNTSLYWAFGHFGGFIEAATVFLATPILSFLVRGRRLSGWLSVAGTVCFGLAFLVFWFFTEPMNREIFSWLTGGIPEDWYRVREQWEYSHATRFLLQFLGLCALLLSVLVEVPTGNLPARVSPAPVRITRS